MAGLGVLPDDVAAAASLLERAPADPAAVRPPAARLLERARSAGDHLTASLAAHALGLADRELDDIPAALAHLRLAVELAEAAGLAERAALARVTLAPAVAYTGDIDGALAELDRAAPALPEAGRARLRAQRAGILQLAGRFDEALTAYGVALRALRRSGDRLWEARARNNRGLILLNRGQWAQARADLVQAGALFTELGHHLVAAEVEHNLGLLAARRGDVPEALARYDAAEASLREHGQPGGIGLLARADTLLSVRLVGEARAAAERAAGVLARAGLVSEAAQARLLLAQAALLDGDAGAAAEAAEAAGRAFTDQHRPGWAALAGLASVQAAWLGGDRSAAAQQRAEAVAGDLAAAGWVVPAVDARLVAGRTALDRGRVAEAAAILGPVPAAGRGGRADLRARAWHAAALLRLASGDRPGALAALRAGLRALDRHRATFGATELRAAVAGHGTDLGSLGLRLAVEGGRPRQVLAWAERYRAAALRLPPALPPSDEAMAADLARLRSVSAELQQVVLAGGDPAPLLRRQAAVEAAVRRRAHRARGTAAAGRPVPVPSLVDAVGDAALVELVETDGVLLAVTVAGRQVRTDRLGPPARVADELAGLRFALRRLAHGRGSAAALAAAAAAARHAGACLDELLLAPLARRIGDRALVVVPTGGLHAVPWALLPSCRGRPVTVAPSAATWWRASGDGRRGRGGGGAPVLVAGPGLAHARREVDELATAYPGAAVLTGAEATAEAVTAALDGAPLAHVACHATFRSDNPLFSALELADGPLTVYDLERLARCPSTLVLSACESGLSAVRPGDELMGLAAAVLAMGTSALVASVAPVPDEATRPLMVDLHRRLRRGERAAAALALAQAQVIGDGASPAAVAAGAGFVCFGGG